MSSYKSLPSRVFNIKDSAGFTLLEIIMVLVIVALLAAITGPSVGSSLKSLTFRTEVSRLLATMRYCRSKAISSKYTYHVTFSFDENGYQIDTREPDIKGTMADRAFVLFPEELKLYEISDEDDTYNQGQYQVSFFPKGNSTGEKIYVKNHNDLISVIKVDRVTGRVVFRPKQE